MLYFPGSINCSSISTPQSVNAFGGFRVQGRGDSAERILKEACELEEAGVFAAVFELIPAALAKQITESVAYPTIGIGAGVECDGQIQVLHDVLGITKEPLKHAKQYLSGRALMTQAMRDYAEEVRAGSFPNMDNSF